MIISNQIFVICTLYNPVYLIVTILVVKILQLKKQLIKDNAKQHQAILKPLYRPHFKNNNVLNFLSAI